MNVLVFVTQFWGMNGAERLGVEIAEDLNARGVRADVLSMYSENAPGASKARNDLLRAGILSVEFFGLPPSPPATSLFSSVLRLRQLIRRNRYDIIETSQVSPTVLASWATLGLSTRHVGGIHDVFTRSRYDTLRHRFWRFSLRVNRRARFYAISEYAKRHWIEYSGTPAVNTRTIYNSIPDDCFDATPDRSNVFSELGIPVGARLAIFVGRMLKRKGIDTILDALGPMLRDENLFLLFVGDLDLAPEGLYSDEVGLIDRLRAQIAREGWTEHVRFLGRRDDIPRLMASSDILVHPARIEGFGLVLAEAMAARLPVVASNVEGIPEVLSETNSIMVPSDDPHALRAAVRRTLARDPEAAAHAIALGRKRAECFRTQRRTDAMIELFEDVLADRI